MFEGLLQYALENIASVEHFFELEKELFAAKIIKELDVNKFAFEVDNYIHYIMTEDSLTEKQRERMKQLEQSVGEHLEFPENQPEKDKGVIYYRVKNKAQLAAQGIETDVKKGTKAFWRYYQIPEIQGSSALIMLITRFEEFITDYFQELYDAFPGKYIDKKTIAFDELSKLEDTCRIKEFIIEREVDQLMRQEHTTWFKQMEAHGLKFASIADKMLVLQELYARRNIWVHNSGIVNKQYLSLVQKATLREGAKAQITNTYISEAIKVIRITIYAIMLESARLMSQEDAKRHLETVFDTAFNSLVDREYEVCEYVYAVLKKLSFLPAQRTLMSQVNYWIAQKERLGLEAIRSAVENWDVSALDKAFQLAKELLLEKYEEADTLLECLFHNGEIDVHAIRTWPLFMNYRKTSHYQEFKDRHSEEFSILSLETDGDSMPVVIESEDMSSQTTDDND